MSMEPTFAIGFLLMVAVPIVHPGVFPFTLSQESLFQRAWAEDELINRRVALGKVPLPKQAIDR